MHMRTSAGGGQLMAVKVNDQTPKVLRQIRAMTHDTVVDFTDTAKDIIEETAPRRRERGGTHARSINYKVHGKRKTSIQSSAGYGGYLEFGTKYMAARPHFAPGIKRAINEFKAARKWGRGK
jgi:hypothetical protein